MKELISSVSPLVLKKIYRLFRYRNERHKFSREIGIRRQQNLLLRQHYDKDASRLIIFVIPGSDWATGKDKISGGTISIVSICEITRTLEKIHHAQTIMCTMREDHLLLQHTMFENDTFVFRFEQLADYFGNVKNVMIHLAEFRAGHFIGSLSAKDRKWLKGMDMVHINIMNQNIQLMPSSGEIERLKAFAGKVTMTTAHQKYCSLHNRNYYGVPIHKLSVWISPEQYQFRKWADKENLLVVSPDEHPMKKDIMHLLENIPELKVQIIRNLTYAQYKGLVSRAKWSLTFGEGLDGYLIEPVFSGAIGFAVYNEHFFTADFRDLPGIYSSYELLAQQIVKDIVLMNNERTFMTYQRQQFEICALHYSKEQYQRNIAAFYNGEYTFR